MIRKKVDFAGTKGIPVLEFGKGDIGVTCGVGDDYTSVLFRNQEATPIGT